MIVRAWGASRVHHVASVARGRRRANRYQYDERRDLFRDGKKRSSHERSFVGQRR